MIATRSECIGCFALDGELHHAYTCPAHGMHPLAVQFRKQLLDAALYEATPVISMVILGDGKTIVPVYGEPGPSEKQALETLLLLKQTIKEQTTHQTFTRDQLLACAALCSCGRIATHYCPYERYDICERCLGNVNDFFEHDSIDVRREVQRLLDAWKHEEVTR